MIITNVNEAGLAFIEETLCAYHKAFRNDGPTVSNVRAWADEALDNLANGYDAHIEIRSYDHVCGRAQCFTLDDSMLDSYEVED